MRIRKEFKTVADIKDDPEVRIAFGPNTYQDFLNLISISKTHSFNPAQLSRNILLIWIRKFYKADKKQMDAMILEIFQSIHGVNQLDAFEKWDNIEMDAEKPVSKPLKKAKKKKPVAFVLGGKK